MLIYHVYKHGKFRAEIKAATVQEAELQAWDLCGLHTLKLISIDGKPFDYVEYLESIQ